MSRFALLVAAATAIALAILSWDQAKAAQRQPAERMQIVRRYKLLKLAARTEGLAFSLKMTDVDRLWNKPCTYCNKPVSGAKIDRLDPARGFHFENSVQSCPTCSHMKQNLRLGDWLSHIQRVYMHQQSLLPRRE